MAAASPTQVMVATDLSDHASLAVRRSAHLAKQHHAALTAIDVLPAGLDAEVSEFAHTRLRAHLDRYAGAAGVCYGTVAHQTDTEAAERGADLIIVGAHSGHGLTLPFLGSAAPPSRRRPPSSRHRGPLTPGIRPARQCRPACAARRAVGRARRSGLEGVTVELHAFPLMALILAIAAAAGLLAVRLKQPLIVAFIGVGILVGPVGTGWVDSDSTIELLARLGIAILLFLVGLRLDLHLIRSTGPVALATGLGQVAFTSLFGYLIAIAFGMDRVAALYVAVALTFSSTIIIVKLLSDKRELDQLHGRIAVGFLIVQDIVVVLVMIALTAFGRPTGDSVPLGIAVMLGKGLGLLAGVGLLMRYVLPRLLHQIARSQELLVLFGVAYAVAIAALSEWLGFSSEVGAFLAGVSLAPTAYRDALGARLVSLRDFLLLFFFLDLGAKLEFSDAGQQLTEAAVFSVFVLVGNPLIVVAIMAALRYPVRVGFLAGLTVAQISEFSLILAALGFSLGHISNATVSLITVVGLITIGGSTYLIMYSHQIYRRIQRWLAVFERSSSSRPTATPIPDAGVDVILYGLGRFGSHLADRLSCAGHRIVAVDFDPQQVGANTRDGVTAVFGSAEDIHLLDALPLARARYVVSAIPTLDTNLALLYNLRHHDYHGTIALTAHTRHDADQLRAAGADTVLEPFATAANATTDTLTELLSTGRDHEHDKPS